MIAWDAARDAAGDAGWAARAGRTACAERQEREVGKTAPGPQRLLGMLAGILLLALAGTTGPAWAVTLETGDLIVVDNPDLCAPGDEGCEMGPPVILRVDPLTGATETISQAGSLVTPSSVVFDDDGTLLVTDFGAGAIFRVDPTDGSQSVFASGFGDLDGIAVGAGGEVYVTGGFEPKIYRVPPGGGSPTVIAQDGELVEPFGIAIDDQGDLLVADSGALGVIRVDLDQQPPAQSVVSAFGQGGPLLSQPIGIAIDDGGDLLVADFGLGSVVRVDPDTGTQTEVTPTNPFVLPYGIAIDPGGSPIVVDQGEIAESGEEGVYRVDLNTGGAALDILLGEPLRAPFGVAVYVPEPGAPLALAAVAVALALRRRRVG